MLPPPAVRCESAEAERLAQRAAALQERIAAGGGGRSVAFQGIRCSHRPLPGAPGCVSVLAEAPVEAPLFDLLSLFYEVDLWHRWAPSFGSLGLRRARCVGQDGPLRLVYEVEANLPWPFRRRVCRFAVEAVDRIAEGAAPGEIVILFDSREAPSICPGLPELGDGTAVAAEVIESGLVLTPGEDARGPSVMVRGLLTLDAHMGVPDWLLVVSTMQLCALVLKQYRQASSLARSPEFMERSCDPAHPFYAHIRRRLAEALPSQSALAPPPRER